MCFVITSIFRINLSFLINNIWLVIILIYNKIFNVFWKKMDSTHRISLPVHQPLLRNVGILDARIILLFHKLAMKLAYWLCWLLHCVSSIQVRSFFPSVCSLILAEYGEILLQSLYSVRLRENTDQKKLCLWTLFTLC